MGILANHVPSVEALKAGVVEVIEDAGSQSKKWFSKSEFESIGSGPVCVRAKGAGSRVGLRMFSRRALRRILEDQNRKE